MTKIMYSGSFCYQVLFIQWYCPIVNNSCFALAYPICAAIYFPVSDLSRRFSMIFISIRCICQPPYGIIYLWWRIQPVCWYVPPKWRIYHFKKLFIHSDHHSSLKGKSPQDRFFSEPECIRRLTDDDIEKSFLLEIERRVSADGTLSPIRLLNKTKKRQH